RRARRVEARAAAWSGALALAAVTSTAAAHAGPAADQVFRCGGERATLVGTVRSDELVGTAGRDVVVARGGDDFVRTGAGKDLVCAGDGFDNVRLGPGRDRALGGAGDDALDGGAGRDTLRGEGDVDALFGGSGGDVLLGGPGTSIIVEGLIGGPGDDRLVGGRGLDTAQYFDAPRGVRVNLRSGRATGFGADVLVGIEGVVGSNFADDIIGDRGGNGLFGQAGADTIRSGGSGTVAAGTADVIAGDQGDDTVFAAAGEDLLTYGRLPLGVSVDLGQGTARGQGRDVVRGVEGVIGSRLDDTLTGGPRDDYLAGSTGDDVIDGRRGDDVVIYRDVPGPVEVVLDPSLLPGTQTGPGHGGGKFAGTDTLRAVEDIWGTSAADALYGDGGRNTIMGFAGDDELVGFGGVDRVDGGAGTDLCDDEPAELYDCEPATSAQTLSGSPSWSPWLRHNVPRGP
ncbi:MAG TPA: calcium-binding protein, partial [Nocardioidaceae bacterium]|nr:calcium-binding protein [Nocardioidaceae bacterium]